MFGYLHFCEQKTVSETACVLLYYVISVLYIIFD